MQRPVVTVIVARWRFQLPHPSPRRPGPSKYLPGSRGPKSPKGGGAVEGLPCHPLLPSAPGLPRWGLRVKPALGRHLGALLSGASSLAPRVSRLRAPPPSAFVLLPDPRPSGRSCEPPAPCEGGGTFQCSAAAPSRFVIRQKAADCCNRYFSLKKLRSNLGEPFSMNTFTPERSLFSAST